MPPVIVAFYGIIVALSVGISGYLSYKGLERTAGEVTLPLVAFLMIIIFTMDMIISYYRSTGRKAWVSALAIWSIAAFFSIASNFNFLYTNFMREDVMKSTVSEQLQVFRDDLVETRSTLLEREPYQQAMQAQTDLKVELDNLHRQVTDPLRPGCGEECRGHLQKIEEILGRPITNLAIPPIGSNPETVAEWYQRYRAAAEDQLDTLLQSTQYATITSLNQRINEVLLEFPNTDRVIAQKGGLEALSEMATISDEVMRRANAVLPEGAKVKHDPIDPSLGRLGEIVYSFQNGFGAMPNPMATLLSLIMASVVDILPLLVAFVLFGPGRLERPEQTRALRAKGGRRVISGSRS